MSTLMYRKAMVDFDWPLASSIAVVMVVVTLMVVTLVNGAARRLNPARA